MAELGEIRRLVPHPLQQLDPRAGLDPATVEAKLEAQGKAPGEIPEVAAGKSGKATLKLPAGRYVMYCNIPGHYAAGMYGTLITE